MLGEKIPTLGPGHRRAARRRPRRQRPAGGGGRHARAGPEGHARGDGPPARRADEEGRPPTGGSDSLRRGRGQLVRKGEVGLRRDRGGPEAAEPVHGRALLPGDGCAGQRRRTAARGSAAGELLPRDVSLQRLRGLWQGHDGWPAVSRAHPGLHARHGPGAERGGDGVPAGQGQRVGECRLRRVRRFGDRDE